MGVGGRYVQERSFGTLVRVYRFNNILDLDFFDMLSSIMRLTASFHSSVGYEVTPRAPPGRSRGGVIALPNSSVSVR